MALFCVSSAKIVWQVFHDIWTQMDDLLIYVPMFAPSCSRHSAGVCVSETFSAHVVPDLMSRALSRRERQSSETSAFPFPPIRSTPRGVRRQRGNKRSVNRTPPRQKLHVICVHDNIECAERSMRQQCCGASCAKVGLHQPLTRMGRCMSNLPWQSRQSVAWHHEMKRVRPGSISTHEMRAEENVDVTGATPQGWTLCGRRLQIPSF